MLKNILIVLLLLFIFYKMNQKEIENLNVDLVNNHSGVKIKRRIPIYGDDQFTVNDIDYNEGRKYKFQTDEIKKYPINEIEINENEIKTEIPKKIDIDDPIYKGIYRKTNLPCQQDATYDFQATFNQPSNKYEYDIKGQLDYSGKTIKDVYNSLISKY
jgi:hypothetical protein